MYYSEDMPEEMKAQVEEQRLHGEAHAHDMKDWIESLDLEGIKIFRSIIYQYSDKPPAAYLMGVINSVMDTKFGICHACAKKHEDLSVGDIDPDGLMKNIPEYKSADTLMPDPQEVKMSGPDLLKFVPASVQAQMDEYGVDFIEYQWPKVKCHNCGDEFVSLEDRMKRDPGVKGCSTCQQKAKWG